MTGRLVNGVRRAGRLARGLLALVGLAAVTLAALGFTSLPWKAYAWLSTDAARLGDGPEYIVVLGGGGIPSRSGLVRSYRAAEAARRFEDATVIVALPQDDELEKSAPARMKAELVLRGVAADRILLEPGGRNTREQALNVAEMIDADPARAPVLVVTSPDHLKRALLSFRKAGFGRVAGLPSLEESVAIDLSYDADALGGNGLPVPDVGGMITVRYRFWTNLAYEMDVARELCALAYYRLKGWI